MSVQIVKFQIYDAHGGPDKKFLEQDGNWASPTRKGRYLIQTIEKHVSYSKYNFWSAIPWGAELRMHGSILEVQMNGKWIPITKVNDKWGKLSNDDAIWEVKMALSSLYYNNSLANNHSDNLFIPNRWVFNDFGHVSVKYFEDKNNNGRFDKAETIMGDFIHTTPDDELLTRASKAHHKTPNFTLTQSHGCVHVKPNDIDSMIAKGYLATGSVVQVHAYSEKMIPQIITIDKRISLYEAHFFPGLLKLVIYKAPIK